MLGQAVRRFATSAVRSSHYAEGPGKVRASLRRSYVLTRVVICFRPCLQPHANRSQRHLEVISVILQYHDYRKGSYLKILITLSCLFECISSKSPANYHTCNLCDDVLVSGRGVSSCLCIHNILHTRQHFRFVTSKICAGGISLYFLVVFFPPENSDIQLAPLLSALVLAWCQYFLLVAVRSLPRLSYLQTLAKLYSQDFNHLLVMMKELN